MEEDKFWKISGRTQYGSRYKLDVHYDLKRTKLTPLHFVFDRAIVATTHREGRTNRWQGSKFPHKSFVWLVQSPGVLVR